MAANIDIQDELAYADDLLVISDSLEQLPKVIQILRVSLAREGLSLNEKRSAIIEF